MKSYRSTKFHSQISLMSVYFIQANLQEQNKQQSVNRLNGHTGGIVYFVKIVSKKIRKHFEKSNFINEFQKIDHLFDLVI